ncbi:MAG: nitroreductase [Chloroflexi bacterium]|nr:nitroreductase [Chloroflexota bacterium]
MDTLQAITARRSVGKIKPERPPRELIERMLEAAVQAPNHHLTEPWRFFVLAGEARSELGRVMSEALRKQLADDAGEAGKARLAKEIEKPLRAPVLIVVAVKRSENPRVVPIEDVEATAAAVENMLLAAQDMGLAAMWRTGEAAYDPAVKAFFGLSPEDHLVAFVYVGYADREPGPRERMPASENTVWRGWD